MLKNPIMNSMGFILFTSKSTPPRDFASGEKMCPVRFLRRLTDCLVGITWALFEDARLIKSLNDQPNTFNSIFLSLNEQTFAGQPPTDQLVQLQCSNQSSE